MQVTVQKAVTILLSVTILCVITLLVISIIRPIPLPFISSLMNNELSNRFHAYYINFDTVKTRIRPLKGVLEFHYDSVKALDYGDNVLASTPKVLAEVSLRSLFHERTFIKSIELNSPKISFIRTTGGALKFDIGNSNDGSSGRVLETIFIYIATASTTEKSFTDLRIVNSDLTVGDEISGSLVHAPNANITLIPDTEGIRCAYNFKVFARGEYLHISGDCLYKTASEDFNLLVNLDEIRPALLTEISPQFTYLTPLEVRLSGVVELELDKFLNVNKTEFNLASKKGTLELTDYFGKNININALQITGKALHNFSHIELDTVLVNLNESKVEASALFLTDDENLDFKLTTILTGTSITTLFPQWFSYLETEDLDCISSSPANTYTQSSLAIDGIYNLKLHQIIASGQISCLDQKLADNITNINNMQKFMMDGTFDAPNLTIIQ